MTRNIPNIEWTHLKKVLDEYGEYFIRQARANLGKNRSNASMTLNDTMRSIVEIDGTHFSVSIEIQDYWDYVEYGRRPGKFPPVNRIKEWITVKPVRPYPDSRGKLPTTDQLAFLIGRKIATKGIEPRPFFNPAKEDTEKHFELAIALAIDEDVAAFIENHVLQQVVYDELFKVL